MMGGLKENAEKSASKLKEVHEDKMENLANELKQMRSSLPDLQGMKLDFSASGLHEGKILVTAKEINFGYAEAGDLWPSPMSFQIKSGERWLIQGDNGSGKTTLLKLITGQLPPRSGSLIRADFSSIYIDQEYSIVRNDRTVYEQAQAFNERHFQEHEIKTLLNRFLFPHDTWEKSCGKLSGGEKMRLAFCCLMISNQTPDLFILDEPTNNLDIQSIEIITSMVRAYRGTILLISHDAYFIRELGIHQIITTFAGRLKTEFMKTLLDVPYPYGRPVGMPFSSPARNGVAASEKGLKLLGITEHAPGIPGTCSPIYFRNLHVVPRRYTVSSYCSGAELNIIDYKGTIDLGEEYFPMLDIRIAGIHSLCYKPGTVEQNTEAMIGAIRNPHVTSSVTRRRYGRGGFEPIVLASKEHSRCWRSTTALSTRSARNSPPEIITSRSCAYARNTRFL